MTVQCGSGATGAQWVSLGVPFPRGFLTDARQLRVEAAGAEVGADVTELARWRHLANAALDGTSIRSVLVTFSHDCSRAATAAYTIRWGSMRALAANSGVTPNTVSSGWAAQAAPAPGEHPQTDNYASDPSAVALREPRVWATLAPTWLARANVRGPLAPLPAGQARDWMTGFARTYVNDVAPDVTANEVGDDGRGLINWAVEIEGWLYDRPYALWNVYAHTGEVKWLRHAHRASQYYASFVAPAAVAGAVRGSFTKRSGNDAKYSLAGGLFAAYLHTGDARLLDRIRAVGEFVGANVATRLPPHAQTTGLWTERHLGVALAGVLYAFEATGDPAFRARAQQIMAGMQADVAAPPAGYPSAAQMAGVLLHRPEVHEGEPYPDMIMSPWMSALLMETVWHYYMLSDDPVALQFLSNYAQFVATRGLYAGSVGGGTYWAPYYLAGLSGGYPIAAIDSDVEHARDVLGLLARGRWARQRLGLPTAEIDQQITRLQSTSTYSFSSWVRSTAGQPRYRAAPTRKVGWWFGTTYDLSWFGLE